MLTHAAKTHSLDNGGEHALLFLMNTKDVQVGNKLKFKSWMSRDKKNGRSSNIS